MSKAFTRESDAPSEAFPLPRAPLPAGTKNHITPEGAARVRKELEALSEKKRSLPEEAPERKIVDGRIQYLQSLIASFVVTSPASSDAVRFGSTVRVKEGDTEETYRIVGVDEINLDQNHISWLSPLARALMSRRVGEHVFFDAPSGRRDLMVTAVA